MTSPADVIDNITKLVELGQEIIKKYKIYTNSEFDLGELGARIRASLLVLEVFGKVIQRGIGRLLLRQQKDIILLIEHLQGVFDRLERQLSRFPRDEKLRFMDKLRWTFKGKSGYEAILHEMGEWRSEVRDVVDAIKLLQEEEKEEDRQLYKQLFEVGGGAGVRSADAMEDVLQGRTTSRDTPVIDEAILVTLQAEGNIRDGDRYILSGQATFVECRYFEAGSPQEKEEAISDLKTLAAVLAKVDAPSMHILCCSGTLYQEEGYERALLFYHVPSEPTGRVKWTLAQAIEDKRSVKPSLNTRFRYAVEIATAIMFIHAAGLVHKSIRPDNILLLHSAPHTSESELSTYLVGFEAARFRDLSAYSSQLAEADPNKRRYQHPDRLIVQEDGKVTRFGIRHDMYSLGVVLLELVMWRRIQHINDPELLKLQNAKGTAFNPRRLQEKLVSIVRQSLDGIAGTRYASAVLCCLQNSDVLPQEELKVRESFYERVLQVLRQIAV